MTETIPSINLTRQNLIDIVTEVGQGLLVVWDLGEGKVAAIGEDGAAIASIWLECPPECSLLTLEGLLLNVRIFSEDDLEGIIIPRVHDYVGMGVVRIQGVVQE